MTIEQYCDQCREMTVWYLGLVSQPPGAAGQTWHWQCSGQTREHFPAKI